MGVDFVHFSPGDVTILGSSTDRLQEWSTVSRRQYQSIRYENRTLSKVSDFSINSDGLVLVPMAKQSLMVYHRIGKALRGFCLSSLVRTTRLSRQEILFLLYVFCSFRPYFLGKPFVPYIIRTKSLLRVIRWKWNTMEGEECSSGQTADLIHSWLFQFVERIWTKGVIFSLAWIR